MSYYTVIHTNGTSFTSIPEGTVNNSLGISLIGQNYAKYGQLIANNFLQLLEHQANDTPPLNPQAGQLWWDTKNKILSFFDGNKFKSCIGSASSATPPLSPLKGDQWWNTDTNQLNIFNGTQWAIVGPLYTKGTAFTGLLPEIVTDTLGGKHTIATLKVDDNPISIFSNDAEFTLANPIGGMGKIVKGMTLPSTSALQGTASNSLKLDGVAADKFVRTDSLTTSLDGDLHVNGLSGILVGGSVSPLSITRDTFGNHYISSTSIPITVSSGSAALTIDPIGDTVTVSVPPVLDNSVATKLYVDSISTNIQSDSTSYTDSKIAELVDFAILDTLRKLSDAVNNDNNFGSNVYSHLYAKADKFSPTFSGEPVAPTPPTGNSSTRLATTEFIANTLSVVDLLNIKGVMHPDSTLFGSGELDIGTVGNRFRNIYGTAIKAKYADLAETYLSDGIYSPGTVVVFGGKEEITVSDQICDTRIAGIISTNPAYLMNEQKNGIPVALTGKVPCKIIGKVSKGDLLVNSEFSGVAKVLPDNGSWKPGCNIGKSLENDSREDIRDIMVAVGRF